MRKGFIVFSLKNKMTLVTCRASGIGAAIVEAFVRAGATVWLVERDEANGRTVAERFGAKFVVLDARALNESKRTTSHE